MAFMGDRPSRATDRARLAALRAEVGVFEELARRLEAGEPIPLSPLMGHWSGSMPDVIGGRDDAGS
jgi:hypothetical protein